MRQRKLTDAMQEAAADICIQLIIATWPGESFDPGIFVRDIMKQYNLQEDPFTKLPCSCKEYEKNKEEYDRQLMEDKYG